VPEDQVIEKSQLVRVESRVGAKAVEFYGLVTEVFRRSRRDSILEESDRYDGRPDEQLSLESRGVTYAQVRVLAARPNLFAPLREESPVYAAGELDARFAYGVDEMSAPLVVGLIRNGGESVAGPAYIDLDYLLGVLGGHMNVTGIAGVGTKSSFLTIVLAQLLRHVREHAMKHPEDPLKPQVRPIILNVKGFDLFWLDKWSNAFTPADLDVWRQMGWDQPAPFQPLFYAPQRPGGELPVPTGRDDVRPYSWSLEDVLKDDLFLYLFSDADREDDNFALLVADLERILVQEARGADGVVTRTLRPTAPANTFERLFDWFEQGLQPNSQTFQVTLPNHHSGTLRRFYRRLRRIVYEGSGIFRLEGGASHPLDIRQLEPGMPVVIDIQSMPDRHLQRFVVAALLKQAVDEQTGPGALAGMHYVFLLDELNRFAPRGHTDPITQLIETVAAELRSRGVILLGAQQQASLVSPRVVENSALRVLGRSGGHELQQDIFSFLPESLRTYVSQLGSADKVVHQPSFRQPMQIRVPRAPWAMRRQEARNDPPGFLPGASASRGGARRVNPGSYEEAR
jgi:DNA helicase HerA-like ATPase